MNYLIYAGLLSFGAALIGGPMTISQLRRLRAGQPIRESGPKTHFAKAGTPTMGGVLIVLATLLSALLFSPPKSPRVGVMITVTIGFGLIGLLDDVFKVVYRRSLGLKARTKMVMQIVLGLFVAIYAYQAPGIGTSMIVPFADRLWDVPTPLFFLLALGTVIGTANSVNLTDGLDGLAAGTSGVTALVFTIVTWKLGYPDVAVFAAALAGAAFGFSWFNAHPAAVMMGDTGSMAIGGALGAVAVLTGTELVLFIAGGIFVAEALSVMIQVVYFRATKGKRLLRMAPLHHHFEMGGWAETKIVARFFLVAVVLGVIGLLATGRAI